MLKTLVLKDNGLGALGEYPAILAMIEQAGLKTLQVSHN